jgi:UDP-GlcNAc:undecaprenyl-phosphate/decaprenyl-phosphate GlcNAc-1-phosphate transferase
MGVGMGVLLVSYFGIGRLCRWANSHMMDVPNARSSHITPVPRGGGLLIIVCSLGGFWLCYPNIAQIRPEYIAYSLGAILIGIVSWVDDLRSVAYWIRLAVHAGAALFIVLIVGPCEELGLPFFGLVLLGPVAPAICLLWLVGITNAYNFMDGIDGLAGGQAVIAAAAWGGIGMVINEPAVSLLGVLIACSSLGFVVHNWSPARIFMGDIGSAFLGLTFGTLSIILNRQEPRLALFGLLVVWPFVFDTIFTLICRLRRRERIVSAHRSHLYQRLVISGYSHCAATTAYLGFSAICVLLAFAWVLDLPGAQWFVVCVPGLLSFGLWKFVVSAEGKDDCSPAVCSVRD